MAKPRRKDTYGISAEEEASLRAQGLRPVVFWVPDVDSEEFKAEARRQCPLANESPSAEEDQAFIDAISVSFDD